MDEIQDIIREIKMERLGTEDIFQTNFDSRNTTQTRKSFGDAEKSIELRSSMRNDKNSQRSWQDEMLFFSSGLARHTQTTLGRIKSDFLRRGMKFNSEFRNHFLYIANNRLKESFDAFLIGLPREMKNNDCTINSPETIPQAKKRLEVRPKLVVTPAKRRREDDDVVVIDEPAKTPDIQSKNVSEKSVTTSNKKIVMKTTETDAITTQSKNVANVSEKTVIASNEIANKKVVAKMTESSEMTAQSKNVVKTNGNHTSSSSGFSIKKVVSRTIGPDTIIAQSRNMSMISSAAMSNKTVAAKTKNVIESQIPNGYRIRNVVSKTTESTVSTTNSISQIQMKKGEISQQSGSRKSLDNARNQTDLYVFWAENRAPEEGKPIERRKSMGTQMAVMPKQQVTQLSIEPVEKPAEKITKVIVPKKITERRKTVGAAKAPQIVSPVAVKASKSEQMNVTMPATRMVTRSRNSTGNRTKFASVYQCDRCPYTTEVKTNLNRHSYTHTGERPYRCKHCDKRFTQKVNLISHLRTNHVELQGDLHYWDLS